MRPGKRGQSYRIDVLLDGGGGNFFRASADACVYNLKSRIPQSMGNKFGPTVMAVQPGLANQNPFSVNFFCHLQPQPALVKPGLSCVKKSFSP
jgi:hypothetical protein